MAMNSKKESFLKTNLISMLWVLAAILTLALTFTWVVFPDTMWVTWLVAALLLGDLGYLLFKNKESFNSKKSAYGLNAAITVLLVIGIVGVLNFLASRYPGKLDLTKNKVNTLSDQTEKLVKGLQKNLKIVIFTKGQNHAAADLPKRYKDLNPSKVEIEIVDVDKDPMRATQVGIRTLGSMQLLADGREAVVAEASEEKLTNALIKITKGKAPVVCAVQGHGERSFTGTDDNGYDFARKGLISQTYEVRDLDLAKEKKVPDHCSAIAIIGPVKSFYNEEIKFLKDYLDGGGHALIALDLNLKDSEEYAPELVALLKEWHIDAKRSLIVDPASPYAGLVGPMAPPLSQFSNTNPITKEFKMPLIFTLARPIVPMANVPAGINIEPLGKSSAGSWSIPDPGKKKGQTALQKPTDKDLIGPFPAAVALSGKKLESKATQNTRIVVLGSTYFATNKWGRMGGNMDFFLNSVSWVLEDENLISIRTKEEGAHTAPQLSGTALKMIFYFGVLFIPVLTALSGVGVWIYRRRL